jgi:uncharacterized phage-associated protein
MLRDKFDARAIANLILRESWDRGLAISNLKLQKLIFLCHAFLLVEKNKDVMKGDFVAWKFGPVHPDVYDAFKSFRDKPIDRPAVKVNPVTEEQTEIAPVVDIDVRDVTSKVVAFYGSWTPAQLVTLTHAENGPWDVVVKAAVNNANVGLRISSKVIEQRFKYLWFGAKRELDSEEPYEDQPLVA